MYTCRSQRTTFRVLSIMGVPVTELRLSALLAGSFAYWAVSLAPNLLFYKKLLSQISPGTQSFTHSIGILAGFLLRLTAAQRGNQADETIQTHASQTHITTEAYKHINTNLQMHTHWFTHPTLIEQHRCTHSNTCPHVLETNPHHTNVSTAFIIYKGTSAFWNLQAEQRPTCTHLDTDNCKPRYRVKYKYTSMCVHRIMFMYVYTCILTDATLSHIWVCIFIYLEKGILTNVHKRLNVLPFTLQYILSHIHLFLYEHWDTLYLLTNFYVQRHSYIKRG